MQSTASVRPTVYRSDSMLTPRLGHLRRLVSDRAVQIALGIVQPVDAAQVDQGELLLRLNDVVGLEVAEEEAAAVQIAERRQDAQDVRDRLGHGQRAPGFFTCRTRRSRSDSPPTYPMTM